MAKVGRIKFNEQEFIRRVSKAMDEALSDEAVLTEIGEKLVKMNKQTVRQGVNPKTGERYSPLSGGYKAYRKKLAEVNFTDPSYGPNKSNLTFSGQLTESIIYKTNKSKKEVSIEVDDTDRESYVGLRGKPLKQSASNKQVAQGNADKGRNLLGITEKMRNAATNVLVKNLKRILRNKLR